MYHHKKSLVPEQIYARLGSSKLLEKCLDTYMQNVNESLHSVVWKFCLKGVFVGRVYGEKVRANLPKLTFIYLLISITLCVRGSVKQPQAHVKHSYNGWRTSVCIKRALSSTYAVNCDLQLNEKMGVVCQALDRFLFSRCLKEKSECFHQLAHPRTP